MSDSGHETTAVHGWVAATDRVGWGNDDNGSNLCFLYACLRFGVKLSSSSSNMHSPLINFGETLPRRLLECCPANLPDEHRRPVEASPDTTITPPPTVCRNSRLFHLPPP